MTSHDVVARLRRLCGTRRVGHGGTLDPMATGVLVCAVGKATRLLTYVTGSEKSYDATLRLGISTASDDADGEITQARGYSPRQPSFCGPGRASQNLLAVPIAVPDEVSTAIATLTGDIMQVPNAVSAIKVNGERAYKRARDGEAVALAARPVTVSEFVVRDATLRAVELVETPALNTQRTAASAPGNTHVAVSPSQAELVPVLDLDVSVTVSSGTYVRALARDLGEILGCGGHLTMLRRTRVGDFTLADATSLADLEAVADSANALGNPLPTIPMARAAAAYLPTRQITTEQAADLRFGRWIEPNPTADAQTLRPDTTSPPTQPVILRGASSGVAESRPDGWGDGPTAAIDPDGNIVAIVENIRRQGKIQAKPSVVF
jgi:tRNA pseudouridine55 synthase